MLKRVYFGPLLNSKVYNKNNLKRKFKYIIKNGEKIPDLQSILDVAAFIGTTVNKILGLCYMQGHEMGPYYLKRKKIYEAMVIKNKEVDSLDFNKIRVDSSFLIPENYRAKKSKPTRQNEQIEVINKEEKAREIPVFTEKSSPFYKRNFLTKPDGRKRLIACPVSYLKYYQKKILREILEKVEIPQSCTGFVKGRSIITNAQNHVGAKTVVKIDLKNFFNSMKFHHAFEVFRGFGYNRPVSGILACICTDWYSKGGRYVPQGAPSSPMIGNLYTLHLDKRLEGLWNKHGFIYSRYADDLTFSSYESKVRVRGLIHATYKIIQDEKLRPNPSKTKVLRKQHKKSVTGITINEKINIDRKWMNTFRGEIYRYSKFGTLLEEKEKAKVYNQLKGKFSYLRMVNPEKASLYDQIFQISD
jgi:hypothetical protein